MSISKKKTAVGRGPETKRGNLFILPVEDDTNRVHGAKPLGPFATEEAAIKQAQLSFGGIRFMIFPDPIVVSVEMIPSVTAREGVR